MHGLRMCWYGLLMFIIILNVRNGAFVCNQPSSHCYISEWLAWSPCSVSCGRGETTRTKKICCLEIKPLTLDNCLKDCNISRAVWDSKHHEKRVCGKVCPGDASSSSKPTCNNKLNQPNGNSINNSAQLNGNGNNNTQLNGNGNNNTQLTGNGTNNAKLNGNGNNNTQINGNGTNNVQINGNGKHNTQLNGNGNNNTYQRPSNGNGTNNGKLNGNLNINALSNCSSKPCQHGTCYPMENRYFCFCDPGYEGSHCQTDKNDCKDEPCLYGHCVDKVNGFTCKCNVFFRGKICSKFTTLAIMLLSLLLLVLLLVCCCCCFWCLGPLYRDDERRNRVQPLEKMHRAQTVKIGTIPKSIGRKDLNDWFH